MRPVSSERSEVPDIGDRFTYRGDDYMVQGYAKDVPSPESLPMDHPQTFGDVLDVLLYETSRKKAFCVRQDADYVIGRGVGGCLAGVDQVVVTGHVDFDVSYLRETTERLEGVLLA